MTSQTTADGRIIDLLRLKMMRLRAACDEVIQREQEDLPHIDDQNCFGAGWASGAISAAQEIRDCIDEAASDE